MWYDELKEEYINKTGVSTTFLKKYNKFSMLEIVANCGIIAWFLIIYNVKLYYCDVVLIIKLRRYWYYKGDVRDV